MFFLPIVASASLTWCTLQNKPVDFRGRNTYHCSSGSEKFLAFCDLPIDQVELGAHRADYANGKWIKAGQEQGIDFKVGYIACEQKSPGPSAPKMPGTLEGTLENGKKPQKDSSKAKKGRQ